MAKGYDLYPGSGVADELIYANAMRPIAKIPQQMFENMMASRRVGLDEQRLAEQLRKQKRDEFLEYLGGGTGGTGGGGGGGGGGGAGGRRIPLGHPDFPDLVTGPSGDRVVSGFDPKPGGSFGPEDITAQSLRRSRAEVSKDLEERRRVGGLLDEYQRAQELSEGAPITAEERAQELIKSYGLGGRQASTIAKREVAGKPTPFLDSLIARKTGKPRTPEGRKAARAERRERRKAARLKRKEERVAERERRAAERKELEGLSPEARSVVRSGRAASRRADKKEERERRMAERKRRRERAGLPPEDEAVVAADDAWRDITYAHGKIPGRRVGEEELAMGIPLEERGGQTTKPVGAFAPETSPSSVNPFELAMAAPTDPYDDPGMSDYQAGLLESSQFASGGLSGSYMGEDALKRTMARRKWGRHIDDLSDEEARRMLPEVRAVAYEQEERARDAFVNAMAPELVAQGVVNGAEVARLYWDNPEYAKELHGPAAEILKKRIGNIPPLRKEYNRKTAADNLGSATENRLRGEAKATFDETHSNVSRLIDGRLSQSDDRIDAASDEYDDLLDSFGSSVPGSDREGVSDKRRARMILDSPDVSPEDKQRLRGKIDELEALEDVVLGLTLDQLLADAEADDLKNGVKRDTYQFTINGVTHVRRSTRTGGEFTFDVGEGDAAENAANLFGTAQFADSNDSAKSKGDLAKAQAYLRVPVGRAQKGSSYPAPGPDEIQLLADRYQAGGLSPKSALEKARNLAARSPDKFNQDLNRRVGTNRADKADEAYEGIGGDETMDTSVYTKPWMVNAWKEGTVLRSEVPGSTGPWITAKGDTISAEIAKEVHGE